MTQDVTVGLPDDYPEGVFVTCICPRGLDDCESIYHIISEGRGSFVCCGISDPKTRELEQDKYRLCFKNSETDTCSDNDDQDLKDLILVASYALSVEEHRARYA